MTTDKFTMHQKQQHLLVNSYITSWDEDQYSPWNFQEFFKLSPRIFHENGHIFRNKTHLSAWIMHITRVVSLSYISAITNTTSVTMWQSNLKFRHGEWQEAKLGRLWWNGMRLDRNWTCWAAGFWDGPVFQSLWTTSQPWCYIRNHIITEGMITVEHATLQADNQLLHKRITDITMNYFANHQLPHHKQDVCITDSIKCYMIWSEWVIN